MPYNFKYTMNFINHGRLTNSSSVSLWIYKFLFIFCKKVIVHYFFRVQLYVTIICDFMFLQSFCVLIILTSNKSYYIWTTSYSILITIIRSSACFVFFFIVIIKIIIFTRCYAETAPVLKKIFCVRLLIDFNISLFVIVICNVYILF